MSPKTDMVHVRRTRTNQFMEEPQLRIGRSQFDRSHGLKTSFMGGWMVPIYVDEVLPGDTFTMSLNGFCRLFSPLDAPIMDNIELDTFFFFVPNRLVWDNWQYFMGEHDDAGAQDTSYTIPILSGATAVDHDQTYSFSQKLMAMMGLPDGLVPNNTDVNALPFRAYHLIWNEWFRDQNVQDSVTVNKDNGPDAYSDYKPQRANKKHDYYTGCLPYLQKGTAQVSAISGTLYVQTPVGSGSEPSVYNSGLYSKLDADASRVDISASMGSAGATLFVDLDDADEFNVNTLRQSVAIQRLLERDARGGTRYVELIKSHFGVTSPDYRLQRPEFLGGGKSYINISPVANTSGVDATVSISGNDEYQGELRGVGTGVITGHSWAKSFTEHGYIIGVIRARSDLTYWQGIERLWSRSTRYDFYLPVLANLGEQAVYNRELYVDGTATDDNVFGYQERWSDYRWKKSNLLGYFNPDTSGSLDFWHLAEDFVTHPTLNAGWLFDPSFVTIPRVTSTTAAEHFLLDLWFNLKCARPMPVHSIPSLIGERF